VLAEGKIIDIIEDRNNIENLDLSKYKIWKQWKQHYYMRILRNSL
jgi:hypothetical protein